MAATARVLASASVPGLGNEKTVNVLSADTSPNLHKTYLQATGGNHVPGVQPTFVAGPTGTAGIPTIVIAGYAGPA